MTATANAIDSKPTREGSPWTGLGAVIMKEMADYLTSARMQILELLIIVTAVGTVFAAVQKLQDTIGQDRFIFLKLFTTGKDPLPSFVSLLSFLVPLVAISLGFDLVNAEFTKRTLSRVMAQPIYRDALLMGKFLAAIATLSLVLTTIWLLIFGMGIYGLGVPPNGEEVARSLLFLVVTIFYGGVWLALSMVFSTVFRQPSTSALASIAMWLFFIIFWGIIAELLAYSLMPIKYGFLEEAVRQAQFQHALSYISPNTLFAEAMVALLNPTVRSLGLILPMDMEGAVLGAPLPLSQSVKLIWPHLTGLIAETILLFALAYVIFQRREIRA